MFNFSRFYKNYEFTHLPTSLNRENLEISLAKEDFFGLADTVVNFVHILIDF